MWVNVNYRDVVPDMYEASSDGDVRYKDTKEPVPRRADKRILNGYIRVKLKTTSGKFIEIPIHRVILASFTGGDRPDMEVDHLNGDKQDNRLLKLEWVTPDENKHRAAVNELYESCEDHYKAVLTNDQVHQICQLFHEGNNIRKVSKILKLKECGLGKKQIDYILSDICYRHSWRNISKYYDWDIDDVRLKKYTKKDLQKIAYMILYSDLTYKEIAKLFPQYQYKQLHQVIKKIGQRKLYKSIIDEVESSTTINNFIDKMCQWGYC